MFSWGIARLVSSLFKTSRTQEPDANQLYSWEDDTLYVRNELPVKIDDRVIQAPYAISILRILLAPAFFCAFMWDFTEMAIFLYIAAFASDVIDGQLEKRQKTASSSALEAYLDPIADFVLVLMSFYAFILRQIYPAWILVVFVFMFLFFIASSNRRRPLYDPVGKYYGLFLITTIGVTLLFPMDPVSSGVLILIIAYTLGLVIYRTVFLWKNRMRTQSSLDGEDRTSSTARKTP